MSKIKYNLYKILVFTEKTIFKNLISITLFFIFVLGLFSSFNTTYDIPEYITVYETEDVIIKYSRSVYDDIHGDIEQTTNEVNEKYNNLEPAEITFNISKYQYLNSRAELHANIDWKMDSILWPLHPNYKETLVKCCISNML
jgi:hypothetical protein